MHSSDLQTADMVAAYQNLKKADQKAILKQLSAEERSTLERCSKPASDLPDFDPIEATSASPAPTLNLRFYSKWLGVRLAKLDLANSNTARAELLREVLAQTSEEMSSNPKLYRASRRFSLPWLSNRRGMS